MYLVAHVVYAYLQTTLLHTQLPFRALTPCNNLNYIDCSCAVNSLFSKISSTGINFVLHQQLSVSGTSTGCMQGGARHWPGRPFCAPFSLIIFASFEAPESELNCTAAWQLADIDQRQLKDHDNNIEERYGYRNVSLFLIAPVTIIILPKFISQRFPAETVVMSDFERLSCLNVIPVYAWQAAVEISIG